MLRIMLTGDTDPELAVRSINEPRCTASSARPLEQRDLRTVVHLAFDVIVSRRKSESSSRSCGRHRARAASGRRRRMPSGAAAPRRSDLLDT